MKSNPSIKTVCFDLGNVLVGFSHAQMCRQIADLCGVDDREVRHLLFDEGWQAEYEAGKISSERYAAQIRREFNVDVPDEALLAAASEIFHLNLSILPCVVGLNMAKIPLGILSNTCEAHWRYCQSRFPVVSDLFCYRVLSFEQGCLKPDRPIYERLVAVAGCAPEQILYLDDRDENVDGARELGLQAVVFRGTRDLQTALERHRVRINS